MESNAAINLRDPMLVRKAGMFALRKELGTAGAAYFIRQFTAGQGNYTTERDKLLADFTLDEIIKNVRELDEY